MLKKIRFLLILIAISICIMPQASAKEKVNLYLFWGDGCPHCAAEQQYLNTIQDEFDNLTIIKYEVWYHDENNQLLKQIGDKTNNTMTGVPVTIIGQTIIKGFSTSIEQKIRRAIIYYSENKHQDIVEEIKNGTYEQIEEIPDENFSKEEEKINENTTVTLPLIGTINFKNLDFITTIPILGLLSSLSIPMIYFIFTLLASITLIDDNKVKIKIIPITFLILGLTSIIAITNSTFTLIGKIIIILLSFLFLLIKINNRKLPKKILIICIIILSLFIGLTTSQTLLDILKTLININNLSIINKIIAYVGYLISYLIPYIILLLLGNTVWRKIKNRGKLITTSLIFIATIVFTIIIL